MMRFVFDSFNHRQRAFERPDCLGKLRIDFVDDSEIVQRGNLPEGFVRFFSDAETVTLRVLADMMFLTGTGEE